MTKNHVKKIGLQHVSFVTCCSPQKDATKKIITILLRIVFSIFLLTIIIKLKIYKGFKLSLCRGFVGESFPHDVRPLRDHPSFLDPFVLQYSPKDESCGWLGFSIPSLREKNELY